MTVSTPLSMPSLLLAAALLLPAGTARADAIDGEWCFTDGRHFSINGPQIVTPMGKRLDGNYSRHAFSYVAPPGEAEAGATVAMTLVNENTVHLRTEAGSAAPVQVWRRCTPRVSAADPGSPTS